MFVLKNSICILNKSKQRIEWTAISCPRWLAAGVRSVAPPTRRYTEHVQEKKRGIIVVWLKNKVRG